MNATAPDAKMWMRVYTMTPGGTITEDRGTVAEVKHGEEPRPLGLGFFGLPPCACPLCRPEDHGASATAPPDFVTMRAAVRRLLADDAEPPTPDELGTLTLQLRGHLQLLIPEVERAARGLHRDSVARACSLACVGEARRKLAPDPCRGYRDDIGHARRLARVLRALCEHHTAIHGATS